MATHQTAQRRVEPHETGSSAPARSRSSLRRNLRRGLVAVAVLVVLAIVAVGGRIWYLNGEIHRLNVKGLSGGASAGAESGTENILLIGSTSRCALKVQNPAFGLCDQGVTGVNSDVVMVLHLDAAHHRASLLSIPRDTFVPNARAGGANKIDAALAEGPGQVTAAIQDDFAIPIQHFAELNFDTFAGVVDALGGIRMFFPEPVFDAYSGLNVATPGCRTLNGFQALAVVRARHLQYQDRAARGTDPRSWPQEAQSDLARIRRDHEFLRVLAKQLAAQGLGNPVTDERIAAAVAPHLQVDSGLSAGALAHLIRTFHSVDPYRAPQVTIPVTVTDSGNYVYKGGSYGSVVFPAQPQDRHVIEQFLGVGADTDTMTGRALPPAGSVAVSVVDASGRAGQQATTGSALATLGYHVVGTTTQSPAATPAETLVAYADARQEAAAQRVAGSLTGNVILARDPAMVSAGAQVTVVTGTDMAVKAPPTPDAPSGASAPPSPPAPAAPPRRGPQLSAPVEPLAPWDPRSCTPGGVEGP